MWGPSHQVVTASRNALAIASARSTTTGPGPTRHHTAVILVSLRIGKRIPVAGMSLSNTDRILAVHCWASRRPPLEVKPSVWKYATRKSSVARVTPR